MEFDVKVPKYEHTRGPTNVLVDVPQLLSHDTDHEFLEFLDLELTILDRPWIQMSMKDKQVKALIPLGNVLPQRCFYSLERLGPTFGKGMFGSVHAGGSCGRRRRTFFSSSTHVIETSCRLPQVQVRRIDEFRPKGSDWPRPPPLVKKGRSIGGELKVGWW